MSNEINQKQTLQEQINQKTRQLQSHERDAVDVDQLNRKAQSEIKEALRRRLGLIKEHFKKSFEQRKICRQRAICFLKQEQAKKVLDATKKKHSEATETLRREERELQVRVQCSYVCCVGGILLLFSNFKFLLCYHNLYNSATFCFGHPVTVQLPSCGISRDRHSLETLASSVLLIIIRSRVISSDGNSNISLL